MVGEGGVLLIPSGQVISEPLSDTPTGTGESATGDDQGPQSGAAGKHSFIGNKAHH